MKRPRANPLTRLQARQDLGITNLWHCEIQPDAFGREVLSHLDGSRDYQALLAVLAEAAIRGPLGIYERDQRVQERGRVKAILADSLKPIG